MDDKVQNAGVLHLPLENGGLELKNRNGTSVFRPDLLAVAFNINGPHSFADHATPLERLVMLFGGSCFPCVGPC